MTKIQEYGFRLKLRARGVHIVSRRRVKVWLKACEPIITSELQNNPEWTSTEPK